MEFNIDAYVFVKLTDQGRSEHKRQHGTIDRNGHYIIVAYSPPKEDDDGWSKWQMSELISVFGKILHSSKVLPFHPTIRIDIKGQDLTDDSKEGDT